VAAGVYLLLRVHFLFTPITLNIVALVGISTAIIGSVSAIAQYDIKKILAYSTISQLGIMITAIGLQGTNAALLHLTAHAFFKAGLFLCVGIITYLFHEQDLRKISGLRNAEVTTFICFLICIASLSGVPFTSGFVSKDLILSAAFEMTSEGRFAGLIFILLLITSILTCIYSVRMTWYLFLKPADQETGSKNNLPWTMKASVLLLALGSGWFIISKNPFHYAGDKMEVSWILSLVSAFVIMLSILGSYFYYKSRALSHSPRFLLEGFYIDRLYKSLVVAPIKKISRLSEWADLTFIDKIIHGFAYAQATFAHLSSWTDRNLVDGMVHGFAYSAKGVGAIVRSIQNGKIQIALVGSLFAIIIFLFFILFN
ncbi:MAG: hypothetical protein L0Y35_05610, partial [Flammeovirgaceae bacterium]|nr:hypothetical protein [Flammeovirgaceae bacterium]